MIAHGLDGIARRLADRHVSRRTALRAGGTGLAVSAAARLERWVGQASAQDATPAAGATPDSQAIPITGQAVADLAGFDLVMTSLMQKWSLPGAHLLIKWLTPVGSSRDRTERAVDRTAPAR